MEADAAEFHPGQAPQRPQLGYQLLHGMDERPNDLLQRDSTHLERRQFQGKMAVQRQLAAELRARPQQD